MAIDWGNPPELVLGDLGSDDCGCSYGFFPGGDPRLFRPDTDCSTPDERAVWRADCERWDADEADGRRSFPERRVSRVTADAILCGSQYGLGTYKCRPDCTPTPDDGGGSRAPIARVA